MQKKSICGDFPTARGQRSVRFDLAWVIGIPLWSLSSGPLRETGQPYKHYTGCPLQCLTNNHRTIVVASLNSDHLFWWLPLLLTVIHVPTFFKPITHQHMSPACIFILLLLKAFSEEKKSDSCFWTCLCLISLGTLYFLILILLINFERFKAPPPHLHNFLTESTKAWRRLEKGDRQSGERSQRA